jgi:hypothetical protein
MLCYVKKTRQENAYMNESSDFEDEEEEKVNFAEQLPQIPAPTKQEIIEAESKERTRLNQLYLNLKIQSYLKKERRK